MPTASGYGYILNPMVWANEARADHRHNVQYQIPYLLEPGERTFLTLLNEVPLFKREAQTVINACKSN